jgi:hypothetical protein
MRPKREQPFDDTRPFARADARAAGLPVGDLLTRRYRRLFHDVHVRARVRLDVRVCAATAVGLDARTLVRQPPTSRRSGCGGA